MPERKEKSKAKTRAKSFPVNGARGGRPVGTDRSSTGEIQIYPSRFGEGSIGGQYVVKPW